jgi:hypothetical protein
MGRAQWPEILFESANLIRAAARQELDQGRLPPPNDR